LGIASYLAMTVCFFIFKSDFPKSFILRPLSFVQKSFVLYPSSKNPSST